MANPIYSTISNAGTYTYELDFYIDQFTAQWEVTVPGGVTTNWTLNWTIDPVNPTIGTGYGVSVPPNPTWAALPGASGITTSLAGAITPNGSIYQGQTAAAPSPPVVARALQFVVSSLTGGSVTLKIIQPFSIN